MRERRTKQEIYSDILSSINANLSDKVKLTNIQLASKLSYDKAKEHLAVLEKFELVERKPVIKITDKGRSFMNKSEDLKGNLKRLNESYLTDTSSVEENMLIKAQTGKNTKYFLHDNVNDQTTEFDLSQTIKEQKQIQYALEAIIEEISSS